MKLSQFSTEQALDVLCEIAPYVTAIVADEELMANLGKAVKAEENMTRAGVLMLGAERLSKIVPIVLKKRRAEVLGIVAAVNQMSVEEIEHQNALKTAGQIRDICKDKELLDFFRSCVEQEQSE